MHEGTPAPGPDGEVQIINLRSTSGSTRRRSTRPMRLRRVSTVNELHARAKERLAPGQASASVKLYVVESDGRRCEIQNRSPSEGNRTLTEVLPPGEVELEGFPSPSAGIFPEPVVHARRSCRGPA